MAERSHSIPAEGTDVGIIGGLAVALWFLILDTIAGHPFLTPSLLGQVVLIGDPTPDTQLDRLRRDPAVHRLPLRRLRPAGDGTGGAGALGHRESVVRYALLPVFLVFEVLFYGFLEVLSERTARCSPSGRWSRQHAGRGQHGRCTSGSGTRRSVSSSGRRRSAPRRRTESCRLSNPPRDRVAFRTLTFTTAPGLLCASHFDRRVFAVLLLAAPPAPRFTPLHAQLEPPSTGGVVALDHELRMLGHYRRVLMIGAHPDDEDTELLTVLVRGMGAEAAYLSLNRGEGGQNLIGPELGEALGLIRTEELLAARRLDGARQFFTRAYDFGYSKSLEETWGHWPRDTILKDVVRIVRRFRPQIVVSVFSGTPRDGHGQHRPRLGRAARRSPRPATPHASPSWRPRRGSAPGRRASSTAGTRFDTPATTIALDGGVLDPAVGKSFHQIAMAGRSLHRSQDMGRLAESGPPGAAGAARGPDRRGHAGSSTASTPRSPPCRGETTRHRRPGRAPAVRRARGRREDGPGYRRVQPRGGAAGSGKRDLSPSRTTAARRSSLHAGTGGPRRHTERALAMRRASWRCARPRRPGDRRTADSATCCVEPGTTRGRDGGRCLPPPGAWSRSNGEISLRPRRGRRSVAMLTPDTGAVATTPYFLRHPRQARCTLDRVAASDLGEPFGGSVPWPLRTAGTGRGNLPRGRLPGQRPAQGEVRRPWSSCPGWACKLDPPTYVWSLLTPADHRFTVTLTHGARDTTTGPWAWSFPRAGPRSAPASPWSVRTSAGFTSTSARRGAERELRRPCLRRDTAGRSIPAASSRWTTRTSTPHVRRPRDGGGAGGAARAAEARAGGLCPRRRRPRARGAPAWACRSSCSTRGARARRPRAVRRSSSARARTRRSRHWSRTTPGCWSTSAAAGC